MGVVYAPHHQRLHRSQLCVFIRSPCCSGSAKRKLLNEKAETSIKWEEVSSSPRRNEEQMLLEEAPSDGHMSSEDLDVSEVEMSC